jgi:hypothetical protein
MGTNPNPRQHLAECIEANAIALADLHHAELTLTKARDLHCELIAKRADAFQNLDNEIAMTRAANLKRVLEGGDEAAHLLTEPVQGHATALLAREQIDEKIKAVEVSLPTLESELIEARKLAEFADFRVDEARAAVVAQVADEMAREFHERLNELRHMSIQMAAMSNRSMRRNPSVVRSDGAPIYGQGSTTIPMPPRVLDAIAQPIMGDYDRKTAPHKKNAIAAEVAAWWTALKNDPNATLREEAKAELFPSSISDSAADVSLSAAE